MKNKRFSGCPCFTIAIILLIPVSLGTVFLTVWAGVDTWQTEQEYKEQREEFMRQSGLWQAQRLGDYEVTYSNCRGSICCENARMVVRDGILRSTTPDCTSIAGMQDYDRQVRAVSEFYYWLDSEISYSSGWVLLDVEYHPELHYVTRMVWQRYDYSLPLEIRYEELKPLDS